MPHKLIVGITVLFFGTVPLRAQAPPIPELPRLELAEFPPVVRDQVRAAYDAARSAPTNADANGRLGMLLELYKRRDPAGICYERAHALDPTAFRWLYYLGSLQSAQGKRQAATTTLREALGIQPGYLPAQLKFAENLLAAGDWEEAARAYNLIAKEHPDAAEAYYGIGRIRAADGDPKGAVEAYRRACELFPAYGAAHYGLAQLYRKLGEPAKAEEHLNLHAAAQSLVPPVPDPLRDEMRALDRGAPSLVERGTDFEAAGRIQDAIAEHEKALELDPEYVLAHANLIILYGKAKEPQKAEEHFRAAVRLNPNHADSYYNYGVVLVGLRKYAEAEEVFRKALEVNPFHSQALHNLGVMREQHGRLDEALQLYRRAVERQPEFPAAHFRIGRILANQKKYDEAISHLLLALKPEGEGTPTYLYALSATYARAGNRPEALNFARRARDLAAARGQTEMLRSIEKDLQTLETTPPR